MIHPFEYYPHLKLTFRCGVVPTIVLGSFPKAFPWVRHATGANFTELIALLCPGEREKNGISLVMDHPYRIHMDHPIYPLVN